MKVTRENVKAVEVVQHSDTRACIAAEFQGRLYHLWLKMPEGLPADTTLYNAPGKDNPERLKPSYRVGKQSTESAFGRALVAEMFRQAGAADLWTPARKDWERREAERVEASRKLALEHRKREAGAELYAALEIIAGDHYESAQYARDLARSAIAKVKVPT